MKLSILITAILFYCASLSHSPQAHAEDIKNYSNCDVCHGAIHFSAEETKLILGLRGYILISQLKKEKMVFLGQDNSVLKNEGTEVPSDAEFQIWGHDIVFIKNIHDGSLVQVVTDRIHADPAADFDHWRPEIYLESGYDNEIRLDNSVKQAWEKMESTAVYGWLSSDSRVRNPVGRIRGEQISKKILYTFELLGK